MADPSSIARVSGRDAVFAPMYLMMRFQAEACIVVDDPHQMRFFFFSDSLLHFFFFFFKILIQNLFGIKILRVFLILLEGIPIFFKVNK